MQKSIFNTHLSERKFKELFITELGWNNPQQGAEHLPELEIDENTFAIQCIAQRNGFQILECHVEDIPPMSQVRKLDSKLRYQAHDYLLIFIANHSDHHCWICPVKNVEKRDLVRVEYANLKQTDFLFDKVRNLEFNIDQETTIVDVKDKVNSTFAVNSEKITKDFYAGFSKQHKAFAQFIQGLENDTDRQWYTSVMLNRLMFCYFIQKKGFLNNDNNYLQNKLRETQQQEGNDKFYSSFYRTFLLSLFHNGLNSPRREKDWERKFGKIPYLNGGMFDVHQLEKEYTIDIPDQAFEQLFDFFDRWQWHLDTRITATGKDINPDVLGYIFEQYINDRAAMGAYYTKEDITEYIGKNCILPYLFDRVAEKMPNEFKPGGYVWQTLQTSGNRYIYDAVKRGYSPDWQNQIPENIARGLDTTAPNLLERRSDWNTPTIEPFALPTEIWRETVERLQRCQTILTKIENGEITQINDFITYNLNIRQFAEDLIANTQNHHFVAAFTQALKQVTILDPTCGSGAFLFAALNILEPLYEVCLTRMEDFNAQNKYFFAEQLEEINQKYRSNRQYFIYKSIILHNLYGVDIMVEATEIAKLRLFLKMVAVVEVDRRAENLGLDPLPDIDFNIRCGNTLVGYANEAEMMNSVTFGDMFAAQEFKERIENELEKVARADEQFKLLQMTQNVDLEAFRQAKTELRTRLATLNDTLNHQLHSSTTAGSYQTFLKTHQPFHWIAEFYEIIQNRGGFDVIIGNPPYVEYNKKDKTTKKAISDYYKIQGYKTEECGNLYAFVIERCYSISNNQNNIGFIVPLTLAANNNMQKLRDFICPNGSLWFSHFEIRPAKLFEGAEQRVTIFIVRQSVKNYLYSTSIVRWKTENRNILFASLFYAKTFNNERIWRLSSNIESSVYEKFFKHKSCIYELSPQTTSYRVHYRTAGIRYWIIFLNNGFGTESLSNKCASYSDETKASFFMTAFNSNLFWWYYAVNFDMFNLKDYMIFNFRLNYSIDNSLCVLSKEIEKDMNSKKIIQDINSKTRGLVQTAIFQKKLSKPIIDEIDKVLAGHYGFTEEELDFIINYDIKYRMGEEINVECRM